VDPSGEGKIKMSDSKIVTERFSNISKLIDRLSTESDRYIFRGMASANWRIQTSIDRLLCKMRKDNDNPLLSDTNQNTFIETIAQKKFIKNQSQNLNRLFGRSTNDKFILDESTYLKLPIILQHYGYPTRIQDWTKCWKIALFFCLEDSKEVGDFCIWSLKENEIPDVEDCLDDPDYLYPADMFEDNKLNSFYNRLKVGVYRINENFFKRIIAQKGVALTTGRADYTDFQQHVEESTWINSIRKYVVSAGLRKNVHNFLDKEGITHDSLYPNDITDGYLDNDKKFIEQFINDMYPKEIFT
jgi:hypothetical protein